METIWQRFRNNGLCKKGLYDQNSKILFNIQLMAFIEKKIDNLKKNNQKIYK